jgi:hypothetical protein
MIFGFCSPLLPVLQLFSGIQHDQEQIKYVLLKVVSTLLFPYQWEFFCISLPR